MNPKDLQPFLDVAISVLEAKDAIAITQLKDFLTASPGPAYIEQSLGLAIVHFAEKDPSTFNWILSNQEKLSPELELRSFTKKMISQRLASHQWTEGKDFIIEPDKILITSQKSAAALFACFSEGEMSLIKVFFQIRSLP